MRLKNIKWVIRIAVLLVVIYLCLPYSWQWKIAQFPLTIGEDIPDSFGEVIIVPGAGCNPGCGTEERLNLAYSLYQINQRKVIVSEAFCFPFERENFQARMIQQWGFRRQDIVWDTLGISTVDNIRNSLKICQDSGWSNAVVSTSAYHQLRCSVIMKKLWIGDYRIARIREEHIEMEHYEPYLLKKPRTIVGEYLKSIHHLIYL
ncbi:MAG: YdcF family protein [Salibacteraceae bacterium]